MNRFNKGDRVRVVSVFWDGTPTGTITSGRQTSPLGDVYVVTFDAPAYEANYVAGDPRYTGSEVFARDLEPLPASEDDPLPNSVTAPQAPKGN